MTLIQPYQSIDVKYAGKAGAVYVVRGFNLNKAGAAALVPTGNGDTAYLVGSAQLVMTDGVGSLVAELCVSNEYEGNGQPCAAAIKKHPDDDGSIYGANMRTPGAPLEHAWFGVRVTTALGSDVTADVWICMKPGGFIGV